MKQFSIFLVSIMITPLFAVTVSDIEDIRTQTEGTRSEVSAADRSLIEEFWETTLNTMLLTENAQDIVALRRRLESHTGHEPLSFYSSVYIAAARKYLPTAFENAERIANDRQQQLVRQNLMVLTAQLKNPSLADVALAYVDDANPVVRYWAVKAVTNSGVIQQLSSDVTADEETEEKILNTLKQRVMVEPQVELKIMIVNFAGAMNHPAAREILLTVADKRIDAYKNWAIDSAHDDLDTRLLIALGNTAMISEDAEVKSTFARKFAELYALVFQAYMKGQAFLSEKQLQPVISVILEVDRAVLDKMLNVPQTGVFRAIQRQVGLEREYETIFGDRLRAGDLGTQYKFDYGKDAAGRPITEPPAIGPPPPASDEGDT